MSLSDREPDAPAESAGKCSIDLDPTGATVNNVVVDKPVADDWSHVFAIFGMSADAFSVVGDTVRCSTWTQSARAADGSRDSIQLFSYSARFTRRTDDDLPADVVETWRAALVSDRAPAPAPVADGGTYLVMVADPQLGRPNTHQAVENWRRGIRGHVEAIKALQARSVALSGIHVAYQGDEVEGVAGSYANQTHTVELTLSQQLELDFDMRVWTMRELTALGLPVSASSVISNHGSTWVRLGGKDPVTTQADNASTHIARQVKKLFDEVESFGGPHIDWHIADGEPGVVVPLSGVDTYFTHGHIEKGKGGSTEIRTRNAIERQILGRTAELGAVPLFVTAHYHHAWYQESENRTVVGCPALEPERSSDYMLNQFGVWSPPGMLGMRVGQHSQRCWSDMNIF